MEKLFLQLNTTVKIHLLLFLVYREGYWAPAIIPEETLPQSAINC